MAFIRCPQCGKEVSNQAAACPNCGHPLHPAAANAPGNNSSNSSQDVSGFAIASLVLGIISLLFICSKFSLIPAIIGLILGWQARNGQKAGKGIATAGIVLSLTAIGLVLLSLIFLWIVGASLVGTLLSCM